MWDSARAIWAPALCPKGFHKMKNAIPMVNFLNEHTLASIHKDWLSMAFSNSIGMNAREHKVLYIWEVLALEPLLWQDFNMILHQFRPVQKPR